MAKCTKCGRPLAAGEKALCPACASERSGKVKRTVEVVVGALTVAAGIVLFVISGGRIKPR